MTRLALFSDIHGVVQALEAVRAAIAAAAPDVIAVAGDYAVNGADPAAVIDGIRELEALGGQFAPFALWPEGVRARRGERMWSPA